MAIRDIKNNIDVVQTLVPAARTNGTGTGATVDLRGYDSAMIVVSFGAWTDGTHTPAVYHSVDGTSFAAASASELSGSFTAISGTAGSNTVQRVGYIGERRYVRAEMVVTGATSGAVSTVNVVRGNPHQAPLS